MKKFFGLLVAVAMLFSCAALAESAVLEADIDDVVTFNRESHVTEWEGSWVLAAAYIGEDFAEEYDVDATGLIAVVPNAITMELATILDASANDPQLGTMVDVASYIHGHTHDLSGTMTISADIADGETYTVKSAWDEWPNNVIRGEDDGDFNYGPAKTHVKGDDDTVHFTEITGVEIEDMEDFKYIGMNNAGQIVLCYSDDNVAKKDGEIGFAYIFVRAE
ncbi:MAG: hypothetical protein Q4F18_10515 [Clostridia bacterium]|nr:hypothetical protein [Clostridia bacterium]